MRKIGVFILVTFWLTTCAFAADDLKSAFAEGKLRGEFRNYYFERDYDQRNDRKDIASGGGAPGVPSEATIAQYNGSTNTNASRKDVSPRMETRRFLFINARLSLKHREHGQCGK